MFSFLVYIIKVPFIIVQKSIKLKLILLLFFMVITICSISIYIFTTLQAVIESFHILFLVLFIAFFSVACLIIGIRFINNFTKSISLVTKELFNMADSDDVNFDKKIDITSKDDIGDLVMAFNRIQEKVKRQIIIMKENQNIILQQEKLVSLGNLTSGIAHNLKSPIMTISSGIHKINKLADEYSQSIEDENVTLEDHKEIAGEIISWTQRVKTQCSYMNEIISTVKEQAIQEKSGKTQMFSIEEVIDKVNLLLKYELNKNNCTLNTNINIDTNTFIKGNINSLIQVINNLILNSIDSYKGAGGKVDIIATKKLSKIFITIKDFGEGISEEVKKKIFKQMITTKGKYGTGIGLYVSYSTIKANFGGDMKIDSELGKGTSITITLNQFKNNI